MSESEKKSSNLISSLSTNKYVVISSNDGLSWSIIDSDLADNNTFGQNILCYMNGNYYYLQSNSGLSNKIYKTSNLSNWIRISAETSDTQALGLYSKISLHSIIHDGSKLICCGAPWSYFHVDVQNLSVISTSLDGINWTAVPPIKTNPQDPQSSYAAWADGMVNRGMTNMMYDGGSKYLASGCLRDINIVGSSFTAGDSYWKIGSFDGVNWSAMLFEKMVTAASCYGNGNFVEIGVDVAGQLSTYVTTMNNNGTINYTKHPSPFPDATWNGYGRPAGLAYGNGNYVAIISYQLNSEYIQRMAYSSNAINWTVLNTPNNLFYNGVTFGNGLFLMNRYAGFSENATDEYAYSIDGVNWNVGNHGSAFSLIQSASIANDKFLFFGIVPNNETPTPTPTQTSQNTPTPTPTPTQTPTPALGTSGYLWGWGNNSQNRLGDGSGIDRLVPTKIGSDKWIQISTSRVSNSSENGKQHSLAIKQDGTLWSWGGNNYGQLGDNTTVDKSTPIQIGTDTWLSVSCGIGYSLGIKSDGSMWAWGRNNNGCLGDGTEIDRYTPTQIGLGSNWVKVSAGIDAPNGKNFSLAIRSDRTLWGWGDNSFKQISGSAGAKELLPVQIGTDSDWEKAYSNYSSSYGIKTDGTLWIWGYWFMSPTIQIPDYSYTTPTKVGTSSWLDVVQGGAGYLGIKTDGTLWAYGHNNVGQLGDGTTINRYNDLNVSDSFIKIGNDTWKSISMGGGTSYGIKTDGTLWSWGYNVNGKLGIGTNDNSTQLTPAQISNLDWIKVSGGDLFSFAISNNLPLTTTPTPTQTSQNTPTPTPTPTSTPIITPTPAPTFPPCEELIHHYTIEMVIKPNYNPSVIFSKLIDFENLTKDYGLYIYYGSGKGGTGGYLSYNPSGATGETIMLNDYNQIVFTRNEAQRISIYLNKIKQMDLPDYDQNAVIRDGKIWFCKDDNVTNGTENIEFRVSKINIYPKSMTDSEVASLPVFHGESVFCIPATPNPTPTVPPTPTPEKCEFNNEDIPDTLYLIKKCDIIDPSCGGCSCIGSGCCPAPWMKIDLSNGEKINAGDLKPGMFVRTKHEKTMKWGDYEVLNTEIIKSDRIKITFDHTEFVCSKSHKFFVEKRPAPWVDALYIKAGDTVNGHKILAVDDYEHGDVVKIHIKEAHTYVCEDLLSHNKSTTNPVIGQGKVELGLGLLEEIP